MNSRYVFGVLLPAVLLLALAAALEFGSFQQLQVIAPDKLVSAESDLLNKIEHTPLTAEDATAIAKRAIEVGRGNRSSAARANRVVAALGGVLGGLAFWIALGGYFATRRNP